MHEKNAPKFDRDQTFAGEAIGALDWPVLTIAAQLHAPMLIEMSVPARTIIELNIEHYRNLLRSETDASKRRTIAKLLAEEEAKLAKLLSEEKGDT